MGGTMPFVVEKGPVWEWFDEHFGVHAPRALTIEERIELVNALRSEPTDGGGPLGAGVPAARWASHFIQSSMGGAAPQLWNLGATPSNSGGPLPLVDHLKQDWFNNTGGTLGRGWLGWDTDPAEIMTGAFLRALEVSLGLEPAVAPGSLAPGTEGVGISDTTRCWPIEFWWICPLPVWQTWVGWRGTVGGPGLVSVIWATPAPADSYLARKLDGNARGVATRRLARIDLTDKNTEITGLLCTGHTETVVSGHTHPKKRPINEVEHSPDNALELTMNTIGGGGSVMTVSPYTDVGGYHELRPEEN